MYRRLLFGIIAGGFLIGGSACYKEVMDLELDPLRPEYVVPAVRDKLTVEKLLTRKGESTTFEYESDGTCVAVYKEEKKIFVAGRSPLITVVPGELSTDVTVVGKTTVATFRTIWELLPNRAVKEAYFDKKTKEFGIIFWYEHTVPNNMSTSLTANVKLGNGSEKKITLQYKQPLLVDLKQEITDDAVHIDMLDGSNYNILKYELNGLDLVGASDPNIRIHAQIVAKELYLRKAIGHETVTGVPEKSNLHYKLDIFSTADEASFYMPDAHVRFTILKSGAGDLNFYVGDVSAKPRDGRTDLVGSPLASGIMITNQGLGALTPEERKKALEVNGVPNLVDAQPITFELNNKNSNIDEAFKNGFYTFDLKDVYVTSSESLGSTDQELPLNGLISLTSELRIPFHGAIKKTVMVSELDLDRDAFPGDILSYLQNPGDPNEVKDAVVMHIGILNKLPIEGYAELDFVDAGNNSILKLNLTSDKKLDNKPLFIPCGAVNGEGRVTEPAFVDHACNLSRAEYERLSKNAKKLRTTYVFTTPGANETTPKTVRILKDDDLLMQLGIEVKAYIEHPKDFIDSMSKLK
jgi:lipoprotein